MALNATVGKKGGSIAKTDVTATVTADKGDSGIKITTSKLTVVAHGLTGIPKEQFAQVASDAEKAARCRTRSAAPSRSSSTPRPSRALAVRPADDQSRPALMKLGTIALAGAPPPPYPSGHDPFRRCSMRHVTSGGAAACALLLALVCSSPLVNAASATKIPITTSSDDARQLYMKGRDLAEKLRATDARRLYEQAIVKDPNFALAYRRSGQHVGNDQGVHRGDHARGVAHGEHQRRGAAHRAGARSRDEGRSGRRAPALHRARAPVPGRRTRADAARERVLRPSGVHGCRHALREGDGDQPVVLAAVQPAWLCVSVPREIRRGRADVQEVPRS